MQPNRLTSSTLLQPRPRTHASPRRAVAAVTKQPVVASYEAREKRAKDELAARELLIKTLGVEPRVAFDSEDSSVQQLRKLWTSLAEALDAELEEQANQGDAARPPRRARRSKAEDKEARSQRLLRSPQEPPERPLPVQRARRGIECTRAGPSHLEVQFWSPRRGSEPSRRPASARPAAAQAALNDFPARAAMQPGSCRRARDARAAMAEAAGGDARPAFETQVVRMMAQPARGPTAARGSSATGRAPDPSLRLSSCVQPDKAPPSKSRVADSLCVSSAGASGGSAVGSGVGTGSGVGPGVGAAPDTPRRALHEVWCAAPPLALPPAAAPLDQKADSSGSARASRPSTPRSARGVRVPSAAERAFGSAVAQRAREAYVTVRPDVGCGTPRQFTL